MKCSSCGNELREGAEFCSFCGEKVSHKNVRLKSKTNKQNKLIALTIIGLAIIILILLVILLLKNNNKAKSENINENAAVTDVDETTLLDGDRTLQEENTARETEELLDETVSSSILYSESYYLNNTLGIIDGLMECDSDEARLELLYKYCINERTECLNSEDSLHHYSGEYYIEDAPHIYYGIRTDYSYDDDGNLASKHTYYKDSLYVIEGSDMPLLVEYVPAYDTVEYVEDSITIDFCNSDVKDNSVVLGTPSYDHFSHEEDMYCGCLYELEQNGYTTDDVETVYEWSDLTENFSDEFWDEQEKLWEDQGIVADIRRWDDYSTLTDIIKLKDGNWLLSWVVDAGGGNSINIYDGEKIVATVSTGVQDSSGNVVFYYYSDDDSSVDYKSSINPLYFEFINGDIQAKAIDGSYYYIDDNPDINIYPDDAQSGVSFIDLDNDGELELHITDYVNFESGIVYNIIDGEVCEWQNVDTLARVYNWTKYKDQSWIYYMLPDTNGHSFRLMKYEGLELVEEISLDDIRIDDDGDSHEYLYCNSQISEDEFKELYKEIFHSTYWG